MPGWKRDFGRRLDEIIVRTVPDVRKCVRWELALLWCRGQGLVPERPRLHPLRQGDLLLRRVAATTPPPGFGKDENSRWVDIHEDGLDEAQMATWVRQAADLPGWDLT